MMNPDILNIVSLVAYFLSLIFFLITVRLFFKLDIRTVIGDITGFTEKRAIENIRNELKEEEGSRKLGFYARDKGTAKIKKDYSRKLTGSLQKKYGQSGEIGQLEKSRTNHLRKSQEEYGATALLSESEQGKTTLLTSESYGETQVLSSNELDDIRNQNNSIAVISEILLCDTEEYIE